LDRRLQTLFAAALASWLAATVSSCGKDSGPAAVVATPAPAPAPATADASDPSALFFNGPIQRFAIRLPEAEMDSLRQEPRKPVPATVVVGTTTYQRVSVHVKGAAGSGRPIDANPALTLNFDKFNAGQRCFGLQKLHLNNSVQDSSRLNELVASEMYLQAGVPTPRTTHALVSLNGRDLGLYVLKEGFDRTFLARHFKDTSGNLYDGGFVRDIDQDLERDAGKGTNDFADLRMLRAALIPQDATNRLAEIERVLDVDRFLTFAAIQIMTDDWDGYVRNRNNYRLYHEPSSGRFVFLPHGMDQLFSSTDSTIEPGLGGKVAQRLLRIPSVKARLYDRIAELSTNVFTVEAISNTIAAAESRLRVAMARRPRHEVEELFGDIANAREGMKARVANVQRQLARHIHPPAFNSQSEMHLGSWEPRRQSGAARHAQDGAAPGPTNLSIEALRPGTVASWRTRIRLEAGSYTFLARATTRAVSALGDDSGEGAGIRISGSSRSNHLTGTSDWQTLSFDFELPEPGDVELVAELRANRGSVRFEGPSMKLVRH
jgi:hypothetical protein